MRKMIVPETVTLVNPFGETITDKEGNPRKLAFKDFLIGRLSEPALVGDRKGIDAAIFAYDVREAIKGQVFAPGSEISFSEEHWSALNGSIKTPSIPFIPDIQICLLPYMKIVTEATAVEVKEAKS